LVSTRIEESVQAETEVDDEDEDDSESEEPATDEATSEIGPSAPEAMPSDGVSAQPEVPTSEFAAPTEAAAPAPAACELPAPPPVPAVEESQATPPPPESTGEAATAPGVPTETEVVSLAAGAAAETPPGTTGDAPAEPPAALPAAAARPRPPAPPAQPQPQKLTLKQLAAQSRKEAKKRKREKKIESFKDYFKYQEPLAKIPPHRLLAINRGERSKILRLKIDADQESFTRKAEELLIPAGHPHAEFLCTCVRDALTRLIVPSLEREVHRDLTERAELHAVRVFARNLRKLLLQPPVRQRRVLAVDPGFRSGCKLAALDEFGDVLGHTVIHVIGKEDIVRKGRQQVVEMVQMYHVPIIAIGNGTACREAEMLIADILANELKEHDVQYVIVNEAGASVYSTSSLGREELPRFDPVLRSAISIGRRLQDPLSELVKIAPANIGVGLYQHDVKVKHLEDCLDGVVESCVNFVGVDVNTASPSLLRYVSGLNQLTARRLYEYRQQHGPFRNREQFKLVPGFGDATFVQAAGFLKIRDGDNPLDATWIHPESYELAQKLIAQLGGSVSELAASVARDKPTSVHKPRTLAEFAVGLIPKHLGQPAAVSQATAETASASPDQAADTPAPPVTEPATDGSTAAETPVAELVAAEVPEPLPTATADVPPPAREPVAAAPPSSPSLAERASQANVAALVQELGVGALLLSDLLKSLTRPGRDPREDLPPPAFRREVMKLEDLHPGMELTGTVLNVVDFGAFVDIGLPDSGLIHISRLADRFIRDPHEVVSVGDILTVWVVEVDKSRRRVSLTAIRPGSETPREQRKPKPQVGGRSEPRPAPQQGGRPQGRRSGGGGGGGQQGKRPYGGQPKYQQKPPKPKPVRPITKTMLEGKEPMRSFSDLIQFYGKKSDEEETKPS
jgi:protein Tex